jgi:hypothetical protein
VVTIATGGATVTATAALNWDTITIKKKKTTVKKAEM